jgi:hypothetical protein
MKSHFLCFWYISFINFDFVFIWISSDVKMHYMIDQWNIWILFAQDEILRKAVEHFQGKNWKKIGMSLGESIYVFVVNSIYNFFVFFTPMQYFVFDLLWLSNVFVAESFKDRTDVQCLHRWQKVLNPELIKGPWSKEVISTSHMLSVLIIYLTILCWFWCDILFYPFSV